MSSMSGAHPYGQWDAAYVLGALSPEQRKEFEEHLGGCQACRDAVVELAGLPGLLARVPASDLLAVEEPDDDDLVAEPPPSLSARTACRAPSLGAARTRPSRRGSCRARGRRAGRVRTVGDGGRCGRSAGAPRPTSTRGPGACAFSSVAASSMTAVVDVVPQSSGTQLRVECQYARKGPDGTVAEGPGRSMRSGSSTGRAGRPGQGLVRQARPRDASRRGVATEAGPDRRGRDPTGRHRGDGGARQARLSRSGRRREHGRAVFRRGRGWCYSFVRIMGLWRSW